MCVWNPVRNCLRAPNFTRVSAGVPQGSPVWVGLPRIGNAGPSAAVVESILVTVDQGYSVERVALLDARDYDKTFHTLWYPGGPFQDPALQPSTPVAGWTIQPGDNDSGLYPITYGKFTGPRTHVSGMAVTYRARGLTFTQELPLDIWFGSTDDLNAVKPGDQMLPATPAMA